MTDKLNTLRAPSQPLSMSMFASQADYWKAMYEQKDRQLTECYARLSPPPERGTTGATPRTDAALFEQGASEEAVPADFARTLERENADLLKSALSANARWQAEWDARVAAESALSTAQQKERERCAKVCEETYNEYYPGAGYEQLPCYDTPAECAAAIRNLQEST